MIVMAIAAKVAEAGRAVAAAMRIVTLSETIIARILGVHTVLLHASGGSLGASLVDCGLQLLKEAIDILQVTLGTSVGKRQGIAWVRGDTSVNTSHRLAVVERLQKRSSRKTSVRVGAGIAVASVVAVAHGKR